MPHGKTKHSPPSNIKHAIGTINVICRIESDDFRLKAEEEFATTKFGKQVLDSEVPNNVESLNDRVARTRIGVAR